MDRFVTRRQNPAAGVTLVILLHVLFIYAFINGLGRTIIAAVTSAPSITFIQEQSPPKPPEPVRRKAEIAPVKEVTVPVPEVPIVAPPDTTAIAVAQQPPAAQADAAVSGADNDAPALRVRKEFGAAYRVEPVYPRDAQRQGITGRVVAHVFVSAQGTVTRVDIVSSTNHIVDREVVRALSQWKFNAESVGFVGEYEIAFNLKD
jgi:periplasmic protein TonB